MTVLKLTEKDLALAKAASSVVRSRYNLMQLRVGIAAGVKTIRATNGYVAATQTEPAPDNEDSPEFGIPRKDAEEIVHHMKHTAASRRFGVLVRNAGEKLEVETYSGTQLAVAKASGEFPNLAQIAPTGEALGEIVLSADVLRQLADLAGSFSGRSNAPVRIVIREPNQPLVASMKNPETGAELTVLAMQFDQRRS